MSAVEDKIVAMKFDNKQFEPAAKTTMGTLDRLKAALNFTNSGKGLNDLQATANRFSLSNLGGAAAGVGGKFSAMAAVALSAINNIVTRSIDAGLKIANAFTLAPLKQGFDEYETKLGSVQTILANTQASGATLKDVNATLQELNTYSDKTIYNFGEMARNIGTFTAAGVDLETATGSIKGIANLAALSGSNSQQASTAMYQLSQAISSGKVSLQDWNSVVNAGMGGTVFQRALAQTAEKMGTLDQGAVKLTGKMKNATINGKSFRESITAKPGEKSWLTSDVLTKTLQQFTGDMSDAELATMGFSAEQIKSIQAQAKTATDAATQVKTFTQLVGTLQESAGSGWANTFEILVGDFTEAKSLFTDVNNVLGGAISKSANARNKMLKDWKEMGGRTMALEALRNVFKAIVQVIEPIGKAFREIFPATTAKQLFELTQRFLKFTETLKIGARTSRQLGQIFGGLFAIFSIGWSVVKAILGVLGDLFGLIGSNSGGFMEVAASVGAFLMRLDQTIKKGNLVTGFFMLLGGVIRNPIKALGRLGSALADFFSNLDANPFDQLSEYLGRFKDRLAPLAGIADKLSGAWDGVINIFRKVSDFLAPAIDAVKKAFSGIGDAIGEAFKAGNFSSVYDALNTGLLAGIIVLIKKFMDKGLDINFGGGFVGDIKETFGALTDTLSAMQTQIQAKTLLLIAGAVAILTASIVALSLIDSDKLTKALTAMGIAFGQLLAAMAVLVKISGAAGFIKVPMIAAAMVLLATAVLILSAAVKVLSTMNWEELGKGLGGVAALLLMLVLAAQGLDKAGGSMMRAGLAMIPLATGILILSAAVKVFATMSWGEIAKGLTALAGSLVIIAGAMAIMPPNMLAQAAALLILSVALNGIGLALKSMGGMTWEEIAKGLVTLAGALVILAGGLYLMTGALPGAAALIVAAGALAILAPVLLLMSAMSWEGIAKGLVLIAGSLLILAGGLTLMSGTLAGSAALLVAAAALSILAPVLVTLGMMSWEAIAKGLVAIAGAFVVLGLAGLVLTPVIPSILALAAALLVLGASMALIGVGAMALATAFSIFASAGTAGVAVLLGLINLIPQFLIKFAEGIIGFAVTIAAQAGKFVGAFASLLNSLLDATILVIPKIGTLINKLVGTILNILVTNIPKIASAGVKLMIGLMAAISSKVYLIVAIATNIIVKFLNGIAANIGRIVKAGTNMVIKFLEAIGKEIPRLADAGAKMVIKLVNGIASAIRNNQSAMNAAGRRLASAIVSGMTGGLSDGIAPLARKAASVAKSALNAAKSVLGINSPSKEFYKVGAWSVEGMANGLEKSTGVVERSAKNVGTSTMDAMREAMAGITNEFASGMGFDPTIRPVLDLSQIAKDASQLSGMLDQKKLSADLSYSQAAGISDTRQVLAESSASKDAAPTEVVKEIKFEQNNYSPKALAPGEIYMNTKSQLSQAKEALK
jgi:tape measure domain-containing protein